MAVHVHIDRVDEVVHEIDVSVVEAILAELTLDHGRLFEKIVHDYLALCTAHQSRESVAGRILDDPLVHVWEDLYLEELCTRCVVRVEISEIHGLPLSQVLLSNVILWRVCHDLHSHVVFAELVHHVKCLLNAAELSHRLLFVVVIGVFTYVRPEAAVEILSHPVDEVSLKLFPCFIIWVQERWVYDVHFGTKMSCFRGIAYIHVDTRMSLFQ